LKEEQEQKQFQKQGDKQAGNRSANRIANRSANSFARCLSRALITAWGDSTEDDEETEEEEAVIALMARSNSYSDEEPLDSLALLKEKVSGLSKTNLTKLLFTLMDEYELVNTVNSVVKDVCSDLKKDIRKLEHANKVLKSEKHEVDEKNLVFHDDFNKLKEALSLKEEAFVANLTKLESESLELKQKVESPLVKNNKLLEKLKQIELDLAANRHCNYSSQGLTWLNTHHNHSKKGLGIVAKRTVYPVNRKYLGLPENIICFHRGETGHYRYACPLRKYAIERNLIHVKQIWVRKDEICMSNGKGP